MLLSNKISNLKHSLQEIYDAYRTKRAQAILKSNKQQYIATLSYSCYRFIKTSSEIGIIAFLVGTMLELSLTFTPILIAAAIVIPLSLLLAIIDSSKYKNGFKKIKNEQEINNELNNEVNALKKKEESLSSISRCDSEDQLLSNANIKKGLASRVTKAASHITYGITSLMKGIQNSIKTGRLLIQIIEALHLLSALAVFFVCSPIAIIGYFYFYAPVDYYKHKLEQDKIKYNDELQKEKRHILLQNHISKLENEVNEINGLKAVNNPILISMATQTNDPAPGIRDKSSTRLSVA